MEIPAADWISMRKRDYIQGLLSCQCVFDAVDRVGSMKGQTCYSLCVTKRKIFEALFWRSYTMDGERLERCCRYQVLL